MTKRKKLSLNAAPPKLRTIGFVSSATASLNTYTHDLIVGISNFIQGKRKYVIRNLQFDNSLEDPSTYANCSGVILDCPNSKIREILKKAGIPFVDMLHVGNDTTNVHVAVDEAAVGRMAAQWFIRRGFKNFAVCGLPWNSFLLMDRSFVAELKKAGFDCNVFMPERTAEVGQRLPDPSIAELTAALEKWIPTLPPHTAMLCVHDGRALRVINQCVKAGRAVPDDIAVMGCFNDMTCNICSPVSITSIDTNIKRLGYATMRILDSLIEHRPKAKPRRVFQVRPGGIIERDSTAVYPIDPPWLANALLLVDAHIDRPVTLPDLANATGVSQTALQCAIRKMFGMSAAKYILSVKMREAKRLVEECTYNIKEIAAKTGFSSPSHFSRTYHAYFGHPPSADASNK